MDQELISFTIYQDIIRYEQYEKLKYGIQNM